MPEAETDPLSLLTAESSSRVDERVEVGLVILRLRKPRPPGTRGLALNWGHSEDLSPARPEKEPRGETCDICARSRAEDVTDICKYNKEPRGRGRK